MGEDRAIRVRAALDRWFGLILVACLLTAGAGAVLAHGGYVDPGSHQEQRVVDEWGVNGSFSHGSTVRDPTNETPFEDGSTVRDRQVYFQRVMPVLSGEFRFRTPGADAPVNFTIERQLVVESTETTRGDEEPTVYWRDTRPLGTNRTTKQPGATETVPFAVNVTRTVEEAGNVSERLDSPGQIRTRVLVTVVATRQVDGAETRRLTYRLPITAESGVYRVDSAPSTERFTETETVTVLNDPSALQRFGGPLALLCGLAGVVGLAVARSRDAIGTSEAEREWLAYRNDRADFDEWITTIRLPGEARQLPVAEAETLADLVDFAIDTDSGVVEEPGGGAYHVVHDGYRYTFEAPAAPATDPLWIAGTTADADAEPDSDSTTGSGDERSAPLEDGDPVTNGSDDEPDATQ
ncbi:hypothetical protein BRC79_02210 [Halobacteriales archaeon QH_8_67_27]|nr:MAG: hypothetical protein BRC79_02210 [Halobacteriales archaeon QH_8_67_27]